MHVRLIPVGGFLGCIATVVNTDGLPGLLTATCCLSGRCPDPRALALSANTCLVGCLSGIHGLLDSGTRGNVEHLLSRTVELVHGLADRRPLDTRLVSSISRRACHQMNSNKEDMLFTTDQYAVRGVRRSVRPSCSCFSRCP